DGETDNGTAQRCGAELYGHRKSRGGKDDGENEGKKRDAGMVAHRIIGSVSEHGYEMRCPDAGTGHQSGSQNPEQASPGNILARAGEKMKGEKTREHAEKARQRDKPQIMFDGETFINRQHGKLEPCRRLNLA